MWEPTKGDWYGKVGYEAYRAHTGGISLVSKLPIPEWEKLSPAIQNAWDAAAGAILSLIPMGGTSVSDKGGLT